MASNIAYISQQGKKNSSAEWNSEWLSLFWYSFGNCLIPFVGQLTASTLTLGMVTALLELVVSTR